MELAERWLREREKRQAEKDAELASRPNAAQIAGTLQKRLSAILEREERLRKRVEELERGDPYATPPERKA
jgi:hypothetical protein